MADPQSVSEYRLGKLEEKVDGFGEKLDGLLDKLDTRYATKAEVREVDAKVDGMAEEQKTKRTGSRALTTGLVIAGFGVVLTAFIGFMAWVVQTLVHVQNLGGNP